MRSSRKGPKPLITVVGLAGQRALKGWTQEELASKLGCHRNYLMRLEHEQEKPSTETLIRLTQIFGKLVISDGAEYIVLTYRRPLPDGEGQLDLPPEP